jgi:hypothetical protein
LKYSHLTALALAGALAVAAGCSDDPDTDEMTNASCSSEMFDKYGVDAFLAVNDRIIELSVAAPTSMVGPTFQQLAAQPAERVEEFRANLANFLVFVYGGPNNYDGPSMEAAHNGLNITSEQYDFFVTDVIVPALADSGVPEEDITDCFAPPVLDENFKNSIVNR